MSRIGKLPVPIPDGVKCELANGHLKVTGPKGTLEMDVVKDVTVTVEAGEVTVKRPSDKPEHRAKHGLTRALINNMVQGVTQGYEKQLEIQGVGYRASMQGKALNLQVGYSHPASTNNSWATRPRRFAPFASPSRIKAKASATSANTSGARSVRPVSAAPYNPSR